MNLYWMQAGGCSGDSLSFLNCECNLFESLENLDIEILWHPSLSNISYVQHKKLIEEIIEGKKELDIYIIQFFFKYLNKVDEKFNNKWNDGISNIGDTNNLDIMKTFSSFNNLFISW